MNRRRLLVVLTKIDPSWGDWVLPTALVLVPIVSFLRFHDYPLLSLGALLSIAILCAIGLAASVLIALRPTALRPIVVAFLAVIFFDTQFDAYEITRSFYSEFVGEFSEPGWIVFIVVLGVFAISLSAAVFWRDKLSQLFAVVFLTILVSTLLLPLDSLSVTVRNTPSPAATATDDSLAGAESSNALPPILHIVLDEHIGLAGIPSEAIGAEQTRNLLRDFYTENGFRLYGRAFSPYLQTENSLSYLFNGAVGPAHHRFLTPAGRGFRLRENAWFEDLVRRGYRFRVYQSDHLDVCEMEGFAAEYCLTYALPGLRSFSQLEIPISAKMQGIFQRFLGHSFIYRLVGNAMLRRRGIDWELTGKTAAWSSKWSWRWPSPASLNALEVADRLVDDLRSAQPGTVYFAHLLVTHRAFMLESDCQVRADPGSWYDLPSVLYPDGRRISESSRILRYEMYLRQIQCGQRLVAEALAAVDEAGLADEAIVIVQGDHGSRIFIHPINSGQSDSLTGDDLRDAFSTLFAVRAPHVSPGYDDDVRSIHALFAELVMGEPHRDEEPVVFLSNPGGADMIPHAFRALDHDEIEHVFRQPD